MYVHMWLQCTWRPKEGVKCPGAEDMNNCDSSNIDAGNWTWVLCQSCFCSDLWLHLQVYLTKVTFLKQVCTFWALYASDWSSPSLKVYSFFYISRVSLCFRCHKSRWILSQILKGNYSVPNNHIISVRRWMLTSYNCVYLWAHCSILCCNNKTPQTE